uniref:Uncharacterized protein n=1 Tax=Ananas comosus var. bracteatus TaxID=296719 RepID=A0A6V7Q0A4_ANACO|nr:unnamed protein product [Ananas comosus var. bracteatus]
MISNVYGPTTAALRADFFHEIRAIADLSTARGQCSGTSMSYSLFRTRMDLCKRVPRLWSVWIALLSPVPGYLLFLDPPSEPSRDLGLTTRPLYFLPIPSFLMPICSD